MDSAKKTLRRRYRRERAERFTIESWMHILDCKELINAKCVASYISYSYEPGTEDINSAIIESGRTLLIPRTLSDNDLAWVQWRGDVNSLKKSGNILEPNGPAWNDLATIDVMILPALHIDSTGNRLGQGGGSYDRASTKIHAWKIGLVHHGELSSELLPIQDHDQRLNAAATPDVIVRFKN